MMTRVYDSLVAIITKHAEQLSPDQLHVKSQIDNIPSGTNIIGRLYHTSLIRMRRAKEPNVEAKNERGDAGRRVEVTDGVEQADSEEAQQYDVQPSTKHQSPPCPRKRRRDSLGAAEEHTPDPLDLHLLRDITTPGRRQSQSPPKRRSTGPSTGRMSEQDLTGPGELRHIVPVFHNFTPQQLDPSTSPSPLVTTNQSPVPTVTVTSLSGCEFEPVEPLLAPPRNPHYKKKQREPKKSNRGSKERWERYHAKKTQGYMDDAIAAHHSSSKKSDAPPNPSYLGYSTPGAQTSRQSIEYALPETPRARRFSWEKATRSSSVGTISVAELEAYLALDEVSTNIDKRTDQIIGSPITPETPAGSSHSTTALRQCDEAKDLSNDRLDASSHNASNEMHASSVVTTTEVVAESSVPSTPAGFRDSPASMCRRDALRDMTNGRLDTPSQLIQYLEEENPSALATCVDESSATEMSAEDDWW